MKYETMQRLRETTAATVLLGSLAACSTSPGEAPAEVVHEISASPITLPSASPQLIPAPTLAPKPETSAHRSNPEIAAWIAKLPPLTELARRFPLREDGRERYPDVKGQLAYIAQLRRQVHVSVQDYKQMDINTQYEGVFEGQQGYNERITPSIFVNHISAERYEDGILGLIRKLKSRGLRVEYGIDRDGQIYKFFRSDRTLPAHAAGLNPRSQGVETIASDTKDITPAQLKSMILLDVRFCRLNKVAVNSTTLLSHQSADLFYDNDTYNNATGQFHKVNGQEPFIDKIDPPQELEDVITEKAEPLNEQLGQY